jgi:hypothetical protein
MDEYAVSTDQIIEALNPLIEDNRLTGRILVDGILILDSDEQGVVDPPVAPTDYDQWGFSEQDVYGCVRVKAIDEFFQSWLDDGDEFEKSYAESADQWYGIKVKDQEYPEDVERELNLNITDCWSLYASVPMIRSFVLHGPRYFNPTTGEYSDKMPIQEGPSRRPVVGWRGNPAFRGEAIVNHAAVGWGNAAYPQHPDWEEYMTVRFPAYVIDHAEKVTAAARRRAAELELGIGAPGFDG